MRASTPPGFLRTRSPRAPALEEGLGRRGRGRAGNLPHPGSIRAPLLSRPVAPQSASYLDVVASPRRREICAGEGREGPEGRRGRGRGRGVARGAGRCRAGAAGPNSPGTRLGGGARLRVCNARAPRRVCVSPLSPSFPASPPARPSGERPPKSRSSRSAPLAGAA